MWTLAIDTSGATGLVALSGDGALKVEELAGRTFSAQLIPAADRLLQAAGITLEDVGLLVVVSGPGSFTGIRVGLSVAKAWAEATGTRLVAVSRLAWCAASVPAEEARVVLDAGRGEVFVGHYRDSGFSCMGEKLVRVDELLAEKFAREGQYFFEERIAEALGEERAMRAPAPGADSLLTLAGRLAEAGRFADPLMLDANYLRRSDAELFGKPVQSQSAPGGAPEPAGEKDA